MTSSPVKDLDLPLFGFPQKVKVFWADQNSSEWRLMNACFPPGLKKKPLQLDIKQGFSDVLEQKAKVCGEINEVFV